MRAARIEGGVVVDIWDVPSLDCYGDMYTLVEAPPDVQIGATYVDGVFTNPAAQAVVPEKVTMRQARLALLQAGLLGAVEEVISKMPEAARIEWEYSTEVTRSSPLVAEVAELLHLSDEAVDELFLKASLL